MLREVRLLRREGLDIHVFSVSAPDRPPAALTDVEQMEMELRRKVDDTSGGGSIRSPGSEPVPQGYADAVADYFRKLSKSKQ